MVGTGGDVIWHFDCKYDKYRILLCEYTFIILISFYLLFIKVHHVLRKRYMTTVIQHFAKLRHVCSYNAALK